MEDKKFIIGLLTTNAEEFVRFVESRSQEKFTESLNGKWSVGQNVDHLIRSLSPVNLALALPAFVLRIAFGKPNRPPRTYQELVDRSPKTFCRWQGQRTLHTPSRFLGTESKNDRRIQPPKREDDNPHGLMERKPIGQSSFASSAFRKTNTPRNVILFGLSHSASLAPVGRA